MQDQRFKALSVRSAFLCPPALDSFMCSAAEAEKEEESLIAAAQSRMRERERRQVARLMETQGEGAALEYIKARLEGASRTQIFVLGN